jgi:hypothetical protein
MPGYTLALQLTHCAFKQINETLQTLISSLANEYDDNNFENNNQHVMWLL